MRRYQWSGLLETDQKTAGVDSNKPGLKKNPDGSVTIWFSPKAPAGQEANWVQTMPGKGWNVLLRLYGPLEPWFDKSWKAEHWSGAVMCPASHDGFSVKR